MSSRPRVTVVSVTGRAGLPPAAVASLEAVADLTVIARGERAGLDRDEAAELLAQADVVGLTPKVTPPMDAAMLARLPRLRAVALHATGTDLYDLGVFARARVALAILPSYCTNSVAEHALGLLLTLSRRLHLAHDKSRGLVPASTSVRGFELAGRTLGLVGFGRIGTRIAALAKAFGMRVVATDPRGVADPEVQELPLSQLLRRSDAVVVACSRHQSDPPVLGEVELGLLRAGSVLIVVSRAATVDTEAALALVRSHHLRGYAVDDVVVDPDRGADLLVEGRVVQTGHCAWWSDEVLERGARQWVEALHALVTGGTAHFAVEPPSEWPAFGDRERHADPAPGDSRLVAQGAHGAG